MLLGEKLCERLLLHIHLLLHDVLELVAIEPAHSDRVEVDVFDIEGGHTEVSGPTGSHHGAASSYRLTGVQCAGDLLDLEDLLDKPLHGRNPGGSADDFYRGNVDLEVSDLVGKVLQMELEVREDGLDYGIEFFSLEEMVEVFVLHKVLDVAGGLRVSGEDFPLLFDGLEHAETRLCVISNIHSRRRFEKFRVFLENDPVYVSGTEVAIVDLGQDFGAFLVELAYEG